MKFICEIFSQIGVTFQSNGPNSTMIDYSDATASNHPLIVRSKAPLATVTATVL